MTAPKHILILTPGFPENEADDTCMPYLQTYLREASKEEHGLRFTVISLQYPYKSITGTVSLCTLAEEATVHFRGDFIIGEKLGENCLKLTLKNQSILCILFGFQNVHS
ncbi:MAG: hypothetical protein ACPGD8_07510 [Flavobacteriales bacterium]